MTKRNFLSEIRSWVLRSDDENFSDLYLIIDGDGDFFISDGESDGATSLLVRKDAMPALIALLKKASSA